MTLKERVDQHDREIAAIRKLIVIGMKMLNRNQEQINDNAKQIRALIVAQRRTDAALRNYIERTGTVNGHGKRKLDLQ
jgi:hypothetical protein